jgi:ABC-type Fe2+-enterobactin transport system substrate-binding protein
LKDEDLWATAGAGVDEMTGATTTTTIGAGTVTTTITITGMMIVMATTVIANPLT